MNQSSYKPHCTEGKNMIPKDYFHKFWSAMHYATVDLPMRTLRNYIHSNERRKWEYRTIVRREFLSDLRILRTSTNMYTI